MKALFVLLSLFCSWCCQANIVRNADLSFGTIIVADPSVASSVVVSPGGGTSSSGSIHVIKKGHPAELLLESFPAGVYLNISTDLLNDQLAHSNLITEGKLSVTKLLHPARIFTDRDGRARLLIGGKLQSQASAALYVDGQYATTVSVEVSY
ncbi:hypothetical protein PRUB_a3260 [Pseudoalteromonas rubra]|uniref:DUF4402 domain-containing protein n=1 Tax=Pseudoalteromonas rubra TaxID=43658 RepID=A0A8T0C287_9GAMM|nr:DUF4402 domain-containing protein [Pseudoalteromonas rubra]KAF7783478.1 hypothetical protein PRUB_a3260 [Pseudoalteromonas rubra]